MWLVFSGIINDKMLCDLLREKRTDLTFKIVVGKSFAIEQANNNVQAIKIKYKWEMISNGNQTQSQRRSLFFSKNVWFLRWGWMFLNILRISVSNVLETFSNMQLLLVLVYTHLLFPFRTNQLEA